jgi:hypothetical protein
LIGFSAALSTDVTRADHDYQLSDTRVFELWRSTKNCTANGSSGVGAGATKLKECIFMLSGSTSLRIDLLVESNRRGTVEG